MAVWRELNVPIRQAWSHAELAKAFRGQRDIRRSIAQADAASAIYRELDEPTRLASSLQRAASGDLSLGLPGTALPRLEEALPIFQESGYLRSLANTLNRIAFCHLLEGRPQQSLDILEDGLRIVRESPGGSEDPKALFPILTDLGATLSYLRRYDEALPHLEEVIVRARDLQESTDLRDALATAARTALHQGDLEKAERWIEEARSLEIEANPQAEVSLLLTLGTLRQAQEERTAARSAFEQALKLANRNELQLRADVRVSLGHLNVQMGQAEAGLELQEEAFELFRDMKQPWGKASAQARRAEALIALGRHDEAWDDLEQAVKDVERLRSANQRQDIRLSYFEHRQDYFDLGRHILLDQQSRNTLDRANLIRGFAFEERRRSRELLERVYTGHRRPENIAPELLDEERRLMETIRDSLVAEELSETDLEAQLAQLDTVRGKIEQRPPEPPPLVGLDEVQRELLDSDTLLLVIGLGLGEGLLWAIHPEQVTLHRLPNRGQLDTLVHGFLLHLQQDSPRSLKNTREIGQELTHLILRPVQELLGRVQRLVIVADDEMEILPFAALPSPTDTDRYLIESHEIVTLPSLSFLRAFQRGEPRSPREKKLAIMADPIFHQKDTRLSPRAGGQEPSPETPPVARFLRSLRNPEEHLDRLRASRQEAQAIAEIAGSGHESLLSLGFDANPDTFFALPDLGLTHVHFATHALLHREPALSGLVLSRFDSDGQERKDLGFVAAFDVARMSLPVELAVLSACETGKGKILEGEGSLTLAWSFLAAGARRVVSSLWKVDDQKTAQLMTDFYREHLGQGLSPAAALRKAQLAALHRPEASLRDWAAFVIQGDWY